MKVVNVNLIASPYKCRLIINDNVKFEGDIIDYETLFGYIQSEAQGTVNIQFHYEWTHDLSEWDRDHSDVVDLTPGEVERTSIGEPVSEEEECEHLHVEDSGAGQDPRLECLDCGKKGRVDFDDD